MFRISACLVLLAAAVSAQDCAIDGIRLGDTCGSNEDCNTGTCAIVHSKCSDALVCECTLSYYGAVVTRTCSRTELTEACLSNEACAATTPHSECINGVCACSTGYYADQSRIGEKYCAKIVEGVVCAPGASGNAFCSVGDVDGNMTCNAVTSKCSCPAGYQFIKDEVACIQKALDPSCSSCVNTGGKCYYDGAEYQCSCPSSKYSSTGSPMVTGCDRGSALIGGVCQIDGSVTCADPNAECVHFGAMTKRYVCKCKSGYLTGPEWGSPDIPVCYPEVSSRQDSNCAQCNVNEGKCYDVDDDGVHDVCKCPTSRSTRNEDDYKTYCDTQHVNVTCDSDGMSVCYTPHNTMEFPDIRTALINGDSLLFIKNKIHDKNCYLTSILNNQWCIDLDFLSCDTQKNELDEHTVSYTNWVILQRQPEKRTISDMYIYVYCSYDSLVNAFTGHVAVEIGEPPAVAAEGDLIQAGVKLDILDQFGNDAGKTGVILGQSVQLVANLTEDKGVFREIKTEVCLASNLPDLSSPFARTTLILYDGCPETNSLMDQGVSFTEDIGNPKVTRSNLFPMFRFDDAEYVFFHCVLRVCMDNNKAECDPSICSGRKQRSTIALPKRDAVADHRKIGKAMKKFIDPDFTVSISAVKVKRVVETNEIGFDSHDNAQSAVQRVPSSGSVDGVDNTSILVGGGVGGFLVLVVLVAVLVVVMRRTTTTNTENLVSLNSTKL